MFHVAAILLTSGSLVSGADEPGTVEQNNEFFAKLNKTQRQWWAFQPLQIVTPPAVRDTTFVRNPIDQFLQKEFETRDVTPLGPASKRSLLRRATFDLIGLPPTPEEIAFFIADDSADAFSRVVERLLASPHYGERWGRHWLDVARYTDYLSGYSPSPQEYSEAFRYRDWVVASLNRDLPYDQFVKAQIAADLMPGTPIAATGALAIGVYDNGDSDKNKIVSDIVADQIDFVSKAFLGLTVACARCHDHKFDAISLRDYYAMAGIFYSSRALADLGKPGFAVDFLRPTLEGPAYTARYEGIDAKLKTVLAQLKKMDEAAAPVAGATTPAPAAGLTKKPAETSQQRERLVSESATLQRQRDALPPPTYVMAIADGGVPESLFPGLQDVPIHIRGNYTQLGSRVPRGFPRMIAGKNPPSITQGSGRLELAQWLSSPDNPLTARVMVNRMWQGHFGEGLVRTTNNFGKLGEMPSNPALIDWLAREFIKSGWSMKAMHRLIMASAAYQRASWQAGSNDEALRELDPANRMLTRFPTRRLVAEEIRDAMVAASGSLDSAFAGPATANAHSYRRALYVATTRKNRSNFSTVFDAADPESCVEKRDVSTVAPQALFFLNNAFVQIQSAALAKCLLIESKEASARIDRAYLRLYGRPAEDAERQLGLDFLNQHGGPASYAAWAEYSHLLLCANEFLILD
jgi:hypothetical protein